MMLVYVAVGGAFGALCRFMLSDVMKRFFPTDFPVATLCVNVLGAFLMGVWVASLTVLPSAKAKDLHLLFAVGALGGFTTFSAFTLDIFLLAERGAFLQTGLYIAGSVVLCVVALLAGMWLVKMVAT